LTQNITFNMVRKTLPFIKTNLKINLRGQILSLNGKCGKEGVLRMMLNALHTVDGGISSTTTNVQHPSG